jgi:hypothetical protein
MCHSLGTAPSRFTVGGQGMRPDPFCCPEEQIKLPSLLLDRDRLPSPTTRRDAGWDRLSTALRYYAII